MADADGVIISSPEYAHGIPGSLKNALDWLVSTTVLSDKPLLLISASPSRGEFVHAQLTEVLKTMSAPPLAESIQTRGRQAFDAVGHLVDDELRQQLRVGMGALVTAMRR